MRPRTCAKFTVTHTADEATDPSVMAFCSICVSALFFYFCRREHGQLFIYMTRVLFLFRVRVRLQVASDDDSVAARDGSGGTSGTREVPARESREGRGAGEGDAKGY